uniref:hypothetical protein n=1 Tax=Algoriphagus sp. TaxID=1872435 RepID=UPI004047EEBE
MAKSKSTYLLLGMILLSLALGIFISYFFVFVNALFISEIGTSKLPAAYLASGVGGLFITWIFNYTEKKWGFAKASTFFGLFFALVMFLIWYVYTNGINTYYVVFFAYAWFWVSSNFTALVFWKLPSNLFNLEETKKYNGIISSGEGISAIISYASVPLLLTLDFFTRDKFLLISFLGILSFSAITFFLSRGIVAKPIPKKDLTKNDSESNQKQLVKEPYFQLIFLSVLLSVVIQFVIDFSLMEVSANQYSDPLELAGFFSIIFGAMRVFELLVKSLISKFLIKEYGVFISLSSLIFALGFITLIGISSFFIGYLGLIFIVAALSKVFDRSLYRSIYAPTINLLYQAYPLAKRSLTQNYADGFGKTIGQLVAALFILSISVIENFELKVLILLLLILLVLIIWLFVTRKLIFFYKIELSNILKNLEIVDFGRSKGSKINPSLKNIMISESALKGDSLGEIVSLIKKFVELNDFESKKQVLASPNDSLIEKAESNFNNSLGFSSEAEHLLCLIEACSLGQLQKIKDVIFQLKANTKYDLSLIELIELFIQSSSIRGNKDFNFFNSNRQLKGTDYLYTSVIQHMVLTKQEDLGSQDYFYLLEERIKKYTYLLITQRDLGKAYPNLEKLISAEIRATMNDILYCLSFKNDSQTLNQIVTMINQGDKSQELISLELLELILGEQEKKWVLPIFKEKSPEQILSKLGSDFPQVLLGLEKRLLSIVGNFQIDLPNIIKDKALEALVLDFPNESNLKLLKIILENKARNLPGGVYSKMSPKTVVSNGQLPSTSPSFNKLLEKFSVSAEQTSLHYFYWMSSLPIPTSDGGYSSYNEALVKTFFPAVFPLEKLNSITN